MIKRRRAREKNTHLVGEEGVEVHVNLVITSIFVEWADQPCVSLQEQCSVTILEGGQYMEKPMAIAWLLSTSSYLYGFRMKAPWSLS